MNQTEIDFNEDVLDIRDIIARFEFLEEEKDDLESEIDGDETEKAEEALKEWQDEYEEEFNSLKDLLEELKGQGGDEQWLGDWFPVTLIHEDYFTDYTEELVKDCYGFPNDIPCWIEIDWEATAKNIKVDYSCVCVEGSTYYYR